MENPTPDTGVRHSIPLPENAVPLSVVELVEYLTPEGERVYAYRHSGDTAVSTMLGLIDLMKHKVVQGAFFPDDD